MTTRKRRRFTVEGRGDFPFDMLRYDCCWPARGEDAAALSDTGRRTVTLLSSQEPTRGRWSSFLWGVGEVESW